jgi:hypothetical protein
MKDMEIPQDLVSAAINGKLIVFAGAGLSKTKGLPSWKEFAEKALDALVTKEKISFAECELLKRSSPRTILSLVEIICEGLKKDFLAEIIDPCDKKDDKNAARNYENLWKISSRFVTTNYDHLIEESSPVTNTKPTEGDGDTAENTTVIPIVTENDFTKKGDDALAKGNVVFHLHGSVKNIETMVYSTKGYLKLYGGADNPKKEFLKKLFRDKEYVVLFVGYSVDELELLEYIITKGNITSDQSGQTSSINKYIIQGYFSYEEGLENHMKKYWESLGICLLSYERDKKNHAQLYDEINRIAYKVEPLDKRRAFQDALDKKSPAQLIINEMLCAEDDLPWYFSELSKQENPSEFFEYLMNANCFDEKKAPPPIKRDKGHIVPFWGVLPYLEKMAEITGKNNAHERMSKIKEIVTKVSKHSQQNDEKGITNFHTWHSFTKILASLPANQITAEDIRLIGHWIECAFDTSLVVHEITKCLLPKIMGGDRKHAELLLSELLLLLLKTERLEKNERGLDAFWGKERPYVDMHWLNDLFKTYAKRLGTDYGKTTIPILIDKISSVLTDAVNTYSYLRRPAIEDHQQNLHDDVFESILISALRDGLVAFAESDQSEAAEFIEKLLASSHTLLRRVGWHIIGTVFSLYKSFFLDRLSPEVFETDIRHEMYVLLQNNFSSLSADEQDKVFDAIHNISVQGERTEEDRQLFKEHVEREWLSAVYGKGSEKIDARFLELKSKPELGKLREHPEFISYHETLSGEPPAPISADDVLAMKHDKNEIVRLFNGFEPQKGWRAPTYRGYADVLCLAVEKEPSFFLENVDIFLNLKIPFLYGLINGLKKTSLNEVLSGWSNALDLCSKIINDPAFWNIENEKEESFDRPNKEWVLGAICDLLDGGIKTDETAFDPTLLPTAEKIIVVILEKTSSEKDIKIQDAMSYALNTTRGRCLGVLFQYALRSARIAHKEKGSHEQSWLNVEPIFDRELDACKDSNYEFSTHCGAYLPNLHWLGKDWLLKNLDHIFPINYPNNMSCALLGFSYVGHYYEEIYYLLGQIVFIPALVGDELKDETRKRILQLATISYLRENEALDKDGGVLSSVMSSFRKDDIREIAWFLYHLRDDTMKEEQVEKVLSFWKVCRDKITGQEEEYGSVLSSLSQLIVYISDAEGEISELLEQAAPYVGKNHNGPTFIKGLAVIVQNHPSLAGKLLLTLIENRVYMYDKEDVITMLDVLAVRETDTYKRLCNALMDYDWAMLHYKEHT